MRLFPQATKELSTEEVSDTLVVVKDTENVDERRLKEAMTDSAPENKRFSLW